MTRQPAFLTDTAMETWRSCPACSVGSRVDVSARNGVFLRRKSRDDSRLSRPGGPRHIGSRRVRNSG
jgi:hypothetical protein